MGKLVVSLDGVVIKEVQITKDKTTLGRRLAQLLLGRGGAALLDRPLRRVTI